MAGIILVVSLCSEERIARAAPSETDNTGINTEDPEYNGEDFTRPQRRIDLRLRNQNSGSTTRTYRQIYEIRLSDLIRRENGFGFSWYVEIPTTQKTVESSDGRTSGFGLYDVEGEFVFFQLLNPRWAYGAGLDLIAPSAGDSLGDGKWQFKPTVGFRYSFLEYGPNTYFVPKVRYVFSANGDPSRRDITELQIAPTFSIELRDHWFLELYPSFDIRINYGKPISGQTGRLFLPFDGAIGRKVTDTITLLLEVGVPLITDYPAYKWKTELRFSAKF